jgi:arylsulfatase A
MNTTRRSFLKNTAYLLSAATVMNFSDMCSAQKVPAGSTKPNIVVILTDDLGYGSANSYGAEKKYIRTPRINQVAKEGMRFTNAYTPASVCSPTRYALLTGRYAWRGRLKAGVVNPGESLLIEEGRQTLPMMLQEEGYRTAHIGKWHLGYTRSKVNNYAALDSISPGPNDIGFDYHFGVPNNLDDHTKIYIENDKIYGLRSRRVSSYARSFYGKRYHGYDAPQRNREKVTQDLNERATQWIRSTLNDYPDKPFFLYFAPVAVHHPITPSEEFRGTSPVGSYGDFIQELDHSVGEIIDALAYAGVLDNTLVIVTSDNGGDSGVPKSPEDQAIKSGLKINGKLRGDKHTIWEGGVRVPFIVRWPGKIKAGQESDRLVNMADIYSTIEHLVTGKPVTNFEDAPDSFSFADELVSVDNPIPKREHMVVRNAHGIKAFYMGQWKYIQGVTDDIPVSHRKRISENHTKPQLYRIDKDPKEEHNLIDKFPEKAEQLRKKLIEIQKTGSERKAR